jgi:murein DD-endopeptidase MepM/ murein hydrolase activator NlpD
MALYFPVPKYNGNYKQGMAQFGWRRPGGRVHAACDLYAPLKSDVKAVESGYIVESGNFYLGTQAIAIFHEGIGTIRYGEILEIPEEFLKINAPVKAGDVIGKVGQVIKVSAMVHIELFDGTGSGSLTNRKDKIEYYNEGVLKNANYERRQDLMNPTKLLDRLWSEGKK